MANEIEIEQKLIEQRKLLAEVKAGRAELEKMNSQLIQAGHGIDVEIHTQDIPETVCNENKSLPGARAG